MFSKVLKILNYNKAQYMMDEVQKEAEDLMKQIKQDKARGAVIDRKDAELVAAKEENRRLRELLEKKTEER